MSNVCMCASVRAKNIFDRVAMENFSIKIDENVRLRLYKICRLCGDDNPNNTDILVNSRKNTNLDPDFHKKIFDCVGIQVTKGDKMPQTACNVCRDKITDFFEFREMCLATDVQTRRLLGLPDVTTPKPDPALDLVEDDKSEVEKTIKKKNPVAKALKTGRSIKPERRTTVDQRRVPPENKRTKHELRRSSMHENKKSVSVEVKKLMPESKKSLVETKKVVKLERDKTAPKIKKKGPIPAKQPIDMKNKYKINPEKFSKAKKRKASGDLLTEKPPNKRERLRDNIIRKLKNPQIALDAVATNVLCTICNMAFCNAGELHRHLDTDHLPKVVSFHCVKCYESIEKKQDIRDHNLWHKLSKTPYECGLCAKTVMSLAMYTKHVQNCTEFVQEFEYKTKTCSICQEEFATQNLYNWHKCIINQLKCEVCQQKFTKRAAMLRHVVRCTAIGLSTSLPVVDSALDTELDPDPDPEPLAGTEDHFADADDSEDGSEVEMNLKPNLEIDIEVPRAERMCPKKQTAPFVVIPSEFATAEKKKTKSNNRKSSAADNSSASMQATAYNNPAVEEPPIISNKNVKLSTPIPTPMVCIKLDGKRQSVNNSKVPDRNSADSVRIKAEVIDSSYEGLYNTQVCSNIKKEVETGTPEQPSLSKCSLDKSGGSDSVEASNISLQSPNDNPIPKPTLKLVIKKQHGTLNSSFVDGSDVVRNDVLPGPKKKKKKKAKIFKIPKGLALKMRQEKLVDRDEGAKTITNNENEKQEERRCDLRLSDKILPKIDSSRKENKQKCPTLFDVNIRIKQESLDAEECESHIGPSEPLVANSTALPIITRVCSGHLEANVEPNKDKQIENISQMNANQIKEEIIDLDDEITEVSPDVNKTASKGVLAKQFEKQPLEANVAPRKNKLIENISPMETTQIKEEIIDLDVEIAEVSSKSNKTVSSGGPAKQFEKECLEASVAPSKDNQIEKISPVKATQIKEEIIDLEDENTAVSHDANNTASKEGLAKQFEKEHLEASVAQSKGNSIAIISPMETTQIKEEIIDLDDEITEVSPGSNETASSGGLAKQFEKDNLKAQVQGKDNSIEIISPMMKTQIKEEIIDLVDEITEVAPDSNETASIDGLATQFEKEIENESLLIPLVSRRIQIKRETIECEDDVPESGEIAMLERISTNSRAREETLLKRHDKNTENIANTLLPVVAIKRERIDIDVSNMVILGRNGNSRQKASIAPVAPPGISQVNTNPHKQKKIQNTENTKKINENIRIKAEQIDDVEANVQSSNEDSCELNENIELNLPRGKIDIPTIDSDIRIKMEPSDNNYSSTVFPTMVSESNSISPVGRNNPLQVKPQVLIKPTETVNCNVRVKLEVIDSDEPQVNSNIDNITAVTAEVDLHSSPPVAKGSEVERQTQTACEVSNTENPIPAVDKYRAGKIQENVQSMLRKRTLEANTSLKMIELKKKYRKLEENDCNTDGSRCENEHLSPVSHHPSKWQAKTTCKSKNRKRMHINPLNPANLSLLSIKVERENSNDGNELTLFNPASKRLHEIDHDSHRCLTQTINPAPSNTYIKQEPVEDEIRPILVSTPSSVSGAEETILNDGTINDTGFTTNAFDGISLRTSLTAQPKEIQNTTPMLKISSVLSGGEVLSSTASSSGDISVEANTCDPNRTSRPLLRIKSEFHSFNFSDDDNSVPQERDTQISEDSVAINMDNAAIKTEPEEESFIKSEPEYSTSPSSEHSDCSRVVKLELPLDEHDEMIEISGRSMQYTPSLESDQSTPIGSGNFIISRVESIRNKENIFGINTNTEANEHEMTAISEGEAFVDDYNTSDHNISRTDLNIIENEADDESVGDEIVDSRVSDNFTHEKAEDSDKTNIAAKEVILHADVDNNQQLAEIRVTHSQEASAYVLQDENAKPNNESEVEAEGNIELPYTTPTETICSSDIIQNTPLSPCSNDDINLPNLSSEVNTTIEPNKKGLNDSDNNPDVDGNEIVNSGDGSDETKEVNLLSLHKIEDDKADIAIEVDFSKPEAYNKNIDDREKSCDDLNLEPASTSQCNIDCETNSAADDQLPHNEIHEPHNVGFEQQMDKGEVLSNIENIAGGNCSELEIDKQDTASSECEAVTNSNQKLKDFIKDNDNLLGFFEDELSRNYDFQVATENQSKDQEISCETDFCTSSTLVSGSAVDVEVLTPISATDECHSRNAVIDIAVSTLASAESVSENLTLPPFSKPAVAERVSEDSDLSSSSKLASLTSSDTNENIPPCAAIISLPRSPASPVLIPAVCTLDSISNAAENPKMDTDTSAAVTVTGSLNPDSIPPHDDSLPGPSLSTQTFSASGSSRGLPPFEDSTTSHLNMLHMDEIAENNNNANIERELMNELESISSNSNFDFDDEAGDRET